MTNEEKIELANIIKGNMQMSTPFANQKSTADDLKETDVLRTAIANDMKSFAKSSGELVSQLPIIRDVVNTMRSI